MVFLRCFLLLVCLNGAWNQLQSRPKRRPFCCTAWSTRPDGQGRPPSDAPLKLGRFFRWFNSEMQVGNIPIFNGHIQLDIKLEKWGVEFGWDAARVDMINLKIFCASAQVLGFPLDKPKLRILCFHNAGSAESIYTGSGRWLGGWRAVISGIQKRTVNDVALKVVNWRSLLLAKIFGGFSFLHLHFIPSVVLQVILHIRSV